MKKSVLVTAAISFMVMALITLVFATTRGAFAQVQDDVTRLHVIDHSSREAFLDVPPAADSLGDQFYFNDPVFNASNTKQIGTDQGICFRMEVGKDYECHWTTYLPGGQLTVEGKFFDNLHDSVLAIIGGTGIYKEARGQMTLHARDPQGTQFDFLFEIKL